MKGSVGVLNVGAGDTKLSFDPKNPAERIRAARIVKDMLRRGYALLVDVGKGKHQRVYDFDEARCEYIIADFDPEVAREADRQEEIERGKSSEPKAADAKPGEDGSTEGRENADAPGTRRGRGRCALPAENHSAIAVARTAGG